MKQENTDIDGRIHERRTLFHQQKHMQEVLAKADGDLSVLSERSSVVCNVPLLFSSNRGSDEKKERGGDKTTENHSNGDHETPGKTPRLVHLEVDRGTAV